MGFTLIHKEDHPLFSSPSAGIPDPNYPTLPQRFLPQTVSQFHNRIKEWKSALHHMDQEIRLLDRYFLMADFSKAPSLKTALKQQLESFLYEEGPSQLKRLSRIEDMLANHPPVSTLAPDLYAQLEKSEMEFKDIMNRFAALRVRVHKAVMEHFPIRIF